MSVHPGFGGQRFMPEVLPKIRALRDLGFTGEIEIDGGINAETGRARARRGRDDPRRGLFGVRRQGPPRARSRRCAARSPRGRRT